MNGQACLLYSNCIPVRGAKKSIICDLQRSSYIYVPNDLYKILTEHKGKSVTEIKSAYQNKYDDIIDSYFRLLLDNEFAFMTDTPELFPPLSMEWDEPFGITNAIIDVSDSSFYDIGAAITQLSDINCKFIQIRFYSRTLVEELRAVLEFFEQIRSNTIGIEVVIPYCDSFDAEGGTALFNDYPRLYSLLVTSSPFGKMITEVGPSRYYIHTAVQIASEACCGVISKSLFSINIKTFTEALKFNSCLNRKIAIDKYGEIKNCPSIAVSYGNIANVTLQSVLADVEFRKLWTVTKDQVNICSDCEFRYICTDCRAFTQNADTQYNKPLKCNYDPYAGEWKTINNRA